MKNLLYISLLFFSFLLEGREENFVLMDSTSNQVIFEIGESVNERISPCSTFKIVLSLIGFDTALLIDANTPTWHFQEGYDDFLEVWKSPQTPRSWMKYSCIWYSKVLVSQLGENRLQSYLDNFDYGNHDISGRLTEVWVNSSLEISPKEQASFIQKMLTGNLPVSDKAVQVTRDILFQEELSEGWKLFGKTGWGGSIKEIDSQEMEIGWFVGWIEKNGRTLPFAYNIKEKKINLSQRIPRVKELLAQTIKP